MRLPLRPGCSHLTRLAFAVLCIALSRVSPFPHSLEETQKDILQIRAAVKSPEEPESWELKRQEELREDNNQSWEEEPFSRAQRGESRTLMPFSQDIMFYQGVGDGLGDGMRKEALTSIAGGLQAVGREKGGFGFRFGRKIEVGE